ncbi:MAG TPA: RagB/SusD family nutrient uptake outer membrane protein [Flavisolibacter sp.]|nr:RagB/SusD family nutrient uptake outer membrane protein [Flavisolibacter sp.]
MKRIFFILSTAGLVLFSSCDKFLERPVTGTKTEEEVIANEAGVQALLSGAFIRMSGDIYNGRLQFISDLMGDQANGQLYTEDFGEIYRRRTSIFGGYKNDFYQNIYRVIAPANKALANLDKASANKNTLEGQARFIRGVMHFEAVRLFAQPWGFTADNNHLGVPIRTESAITPGTRGTVKQVYDAVIADLQAAENLLPDVASEGFPSKWAAKAFLAKVFFQQNNFQQAFNYADQVIKSNKFQLDANYNNRFSLNAGTTGTREGIFVVKNVMNNFSPGGELRDRYRSDGANFQAGGDFHVTDIYFNQATQSNDVRKAWYMKNSNGFNVITKYNKDFFDLPIVHLTEIKLIRAEAGAELGAANLPIAIADINDILTRAYGGTGQNLSTSASAGLVITTARTQREFEMIGEGNRVQEIKRIGARSGINIDRRGTAWNCPGMALQFPNGEQASDINFPMNQEGGCQ